MRIKSSAYSFSKIKLFTHNDLDGVGCAVLAKYLLNSDVDIEMIPADSVDEKVSEWLSNRYESYSEVWITDLSINSHTESLIENSPYRLVIRDHHETALGCNNYRGDCLVVEGYNCGTSLFYNYLIGRYPGVDFKPYEDFVRVVKDYDTWEWSKNNNALAPELNRLLTILGKRGFIDRFVSNPSIYCEDDMNAWSNLERYLLILEDKRCSCYMYGRLLNMQKIVIEGLRVGVIFADQYISEIANEALGNNPDLSLAVVVNLPYGISIRSRTGSSEVDVGEIATRLGGGGHKDSGGVPISASELGYLIKNNPYIKDNKVIDNNKRLEVLGIA